jgi:hypothetical protein
VKEARPKWSVATVIDAEYAAHRQRFLAEQGYAYTIAADDVLGPPIPLID